ncbi:MAG: sodium ion-translocating decarboxylase subunit beta [Clostridiales bacterium]|nr:sodium ion-translocating decarboxylase subunit beta [Clostridiales bacterium]
MILVALLFLYLAIAKGYEPLLLVPIAFGMLLVNMYPSITAKPSTTYAYYENGDSVDSIIATVSVDEAGNFSFKYKVDGELTKLNIIDDKEEQKSAKAYVKTVYLDYTGQEVDFKANNIEADSTSLTKNYIAYVDDKEVFGVSYVGMVPYDNMAGNIFVFNGDKQVPFQKTSHTNGGLLYYFFMLDEWSILPCLIFMGVGAMTDFGPLIANPKSFLLGAAAQIGIFTAYLLAILLGFSDAQAAAVSIIGGADGPTSIFLAGKLGQTALMGPIAVAAYSYMSLVPIIQPPIMKLLTTEKERKIKMEQLRPVSKLEKILFPIIVTIVVVLILPDTAPLIGCLMLGNLFRESGVVRQLQETASNAMMYIVVILLGTSVGATTSAEAFLQLTTIKIVVLGLVAFAFGTAAGVLFGKLMCKFTHGGVNPLIGSAGVSAVPMAARVSQKVGAEEDPSNFLLMHAMGPNVAGVIGTAVAAGVFMAVFGV